MRNVWLVMTAEYQRLVRRRSFVLATLGVPALIGFVILVGVIASRAGNDPRPIGVIDQAGVTQPAQAGSVRGEGDAVAVIAYTDEADARRALDEGTLQAYYVIPSGYLQDRTVQLRFLDESPSNAARRALDSYLRAGLAARLPDDLSAAARTVLQEGPELRYRSLSDARLQGEEGIVGALLPFVVGFLFIMVVMSSGGYLLQAITTEKENRMIEVLFTSLSPFQLVAGKTLGLIAVAFTQLFVWLLALVLAMVVAVRQVDFLASAVIDWAIIGIVLVYFIPTYMLVAGLMITIGSMVTELQYAQQISGLVNLLFIFPFFVLVLAFTSPNSPLMVALTLFPTTALITVAMRWGVAAIPAWQLGLSLALLVAAAFGSIWVAAQVFRQGMLRYGQPLNLAGVVGMLRTRGGAS